MKLPTSIIRLNLIFAIVALLAACGGGGGGQVDPVILNAVSALFSTNGANWNDYVVGNERLTATGDSACDAFDPPPCLHAGERRVVEATGMTSCAGLTASDDLGAFNWACDDSSGPVNLVSTGLADGMYLSHLINFIAEDWRLNAVTVFENGVAWGKTPGSVWWNNPIVVDFDSTPLPQNTDPLIGTVYLYTAQPSNTPVFDDGKIAVVIQPGVTLDGDGGPLLDTSGFDYIWLEGKLDGLNIGGKGAKRSRVNEYIFTNIKI
jgi:hypothetical protein